MSTKNFFDRYAGDGPGHMALFVLLSILLHALFLAAFGRIDTEPGARTERLPIVVDVVPAPPAEKGGGIEKEVVELPPPRPFERVTEKPAKETRYLSDRNQVVEKETFPEKGPRALPSASAPAPALVLPPEPSAEAGGAEATEGGRKAAEGVSGEKTPATDEEGVVTVERTGAEGGAGEGVRAAGGAPAAGEAGGPKLFLSDRRLTELSERYESTIPEGERGKTLTMNTTEFRYQRYVLDVKRKVEFHWEYPALAAKNGWQGKLQANFTINSDGTLKEVWLVKSSGYPVLDDAVITALRLAAPFPPFPENMPIKDISIKGFFEYITSGRQQ